MYAPAHPADCIAQRVAPARPTVPCRIGASRMPSGQSYRKSKGPNAEIVPEFLDRKIPVSDKRTTGSHDCMSRLYLTRIPPSRRSRARSCRVRMHAQRFMRSVTLALSGRRLGVTITRDNGISRRKRVVEKSMHSREFIKIAYYKLRIVGYDYYRQAR